MAAANPCPCGFGGDARCRCTEADLDRYRRKLSGPLLDRIDLHVHCPRPSTTEIAGPPSPDSAAIRERVLAARRFRGERHRTAGPRRLEDDLSPGARETLARCYASGFLSARGRARVLRLARTIADLDGSGGIGAAHLGEGMHLRQQVEGDRREVAA